MLVIHHYYYCDYQRGTSKISESNYSIKKKDCKIYAIHEKKIKKKMKKNLVFNWSNWIVETWRSLLYFFLIKRKRHSN